LVVSARSEPESKEIATPGSSRDLARHTLIYGSGYVAMAAVSLVLVPLYTHYLSPADFGLLALLLVMSGLMKQFFDLGFMNSVGRFYFDHPHDDSSRGLDQMRTTSLAFMVIYGGLLTAALWLLAAPCSRVLTGTTAHVDLVRIVALTLYADALTIVPLTLIRMQEQSVRFVLMTLVRLVATLVLSVFFVASLHWGVRGALLGALIPTVFLLALLMPDYLAALRARPSWALLRRMLSFGLPFFPVLLAVWVIDASDRYLIELLRTRDEVGYYSLAYRVAAIMQIAVAAFSMGWAPLRYKIYARPDAPFVYRRLTTAYVLAAGLVASALAVLAPTIVALAAPPSYKPAADVVPFLVLSYVLYGLYILMVTGMGVTKKTGPIALVAIVGALVNIGLNLLFLPRWGMQAAALATVGAYALMVGGAWFYSQKVYPVPYDWRRIAHITVAALVTTAVASSVAPPGILVGLAAGIATCIAYVAVLGVTGAITPQEILVARDRITGAGSRLRTRLARQGISG
jgi:O-antigen/teichoic acid export membrane protein